MVIRNGEHPGPAERAGRPSGARSSRPHRRFDRTPTIAVLVVAAFVGSVVAHRIDPVDAGPAAPQVFGTAEIAAGAGSDRSHRIHGTGAVDDGFDQPVEEAIVGGSIIDIEAAPWQVLVFPGPYLCGGSVYSATWIITAAHCVDGFGPSEVDVVAGFDDRSEIPADAAIGAASVIVHPGWDPDTFENDIALVELSEPMVLGSTIAPIALPVQDPSTWPSAGTSAFVTGFGSTSSDGGTSQHLRGATVQMTVGPGSQTCAEYPSGWYFRLTMLCAGLPEGGVDSCQGDSGGPLAIQVSGTWYLAGITSFGIGCGLADYPGIYTRVTSFVSWVVATAVPVPTTSTTTTSTTTTSTTTTASTTVPAPTSTTTVPTTTVPPTPDLPTPDRVAGADRFATAVALSKRAFGPDVDVVYVATGRSYADALAAGVIAGLDDGPILLVEPDAVPDVVADELRRLRPDHIVIVGGEAAVSDAVRAELEQIVETMVAGAEVDAEVTGAAIAGTVSAVDSVESRSSAVNGTVSTSSASVTRIAGPDRYATATALSQSRFDPDVPVVYIVSGEGFPDALSAVPLPGRAGGPVLLVRRDSIPGAVATELRRLAPRRIVIVGGSAAVSDDVARELTEFSRQLSRIAGPNRYGTSVELSRIGYVGGAEIVFLTSGADFPDALGAGPVAIVRDGPILLVRPHCVPDEVHTELERLAPAEVVVVGGAAAVSAGVLEYETCPA